MTVTRTTRKKAAVKVFVLPVNETVRGLSKVALIEHGKLGLPQAQDAGIELLRRATNKSKIVRTAG
jgi:hypothetical protein